MQRLSKAIGAAAIFLGGIALALILALVAGQIAMRVLTGQSLTWSDELARLFFIYLVFIGSAEISARHGHIAVDLRNTFGVPEAIDRILDVIRMVLCISVLAVIAWGTWQIIPVVENMQRPATRISTAWMYWPVLAGSILMIVATAINLGVLLTCGRLIPGTYPQAKRG
ncbi:TRAP transporter small permease [Palleronia caenipelagi]|uniref:TRAP transporter small permease protein n=1 Tax=Palleronia caenipelagi TaxID=2489174 RepID=A0A547PMH5_9RHOB|nr:TRAP transporter small permease [Palleronia caenipelagi]TRD15349.1 TRAP transporter small permease [Palleronia caenipelagi]